MTAIEAEKLFIEAVASCDRVLMRAALDDVAETDALRPKEFASDDDAF